MVGKFEIQKDTVQVIAESAATHVGRIASIITGAVREVTHEFGEWASDVFEMREAAGKAEVARQADEARAAEGEPSYASSYDALGEDVLGDIAGRNLPSG